ncbi:MAG TPA: hypothetical protein VK358_12995 [Longimicrobium sp.]|nr:hypothetical protein [Longimicrobium sp.]
MQDVVTIELPPDVSADLDQFATRNGVAREAVVREALRDFLFFRRMRDARIRMTAEAQAQGLFTDEQVFDRVS